MYQDWTLLEDCGKRKLHEGRILFMIRLLDYIIAKCESLKVFNYEVFKTTYDLKQEKRQKIG